MIKCNYIRLYAGQLNKIINLKFIRILVKKKKNKTRREAYVIVLFY